MPTTPGAVRCVYCVPYESTDFRVGFCCSAVFVYIHCAAAARELTKTNNGHLYKYGLYKAPATHHIIILYRPFYLVRLRDDAREPQSKRGGISVIRLSKDIICTYLYNVPKNNSRNLNHRRFCFYRNLHTYIVLYTRHIYYFESICRTPAVV